MYNRYTATNRITGELVDFLVDSRGVVFALNGTRQNALPEHVLTDADLFFRLRGWKVSRVE